MIGLDPHICQMCPDFSAPSVPNEVSPRVMLRGGLLLTVEWSGGSIF